LLADLGVSRTHSRPQNSSDNPYSEAQFKALKYHPDFPDRFGSLEDARDFCRRFFQWHNHEHYHSGLALLTPATVHFGRAEEVIRKRGVVLRAAYAEHPGQSVSKMRARRAPCRAPRAPQGRRPKLSQRKPLRDYGTIPPQLLQRLPSLTCEGPQQAAHSMLTRPGTRQRADPNPTRPSWR